MLLVAVGRIVVWSTAVWMVGTVEILKDLGRDMASILLATRLI